MKGILIIFFLITIASITRITHAQWQQTDGGVGETITSLKTYNATLFYLSYWGVSRSVDNGISWQPASTGLPTPQGNSVLGYSKGVIFAGIWGSGIYRSTNNGNTWQASNSGISSSIDYQIYSLFSDSTFLYAGTYVGRGVFYRSSDNGVTWDSMCYLPNAIDLTSIGTVLLAAQLGDYSGVRRSYNNGITWASAINGLTNIKNASAFALLGSKLLLSADSAGYYKLYYTTNAGTNWIALNPGLRRRVYDFAVSTQYLFAGTYDGVFLSTDSGVNWTSVSAGLTNRSVYGLAIANNTLFAGTDDGVWKRPLSEMISVENRSLPEFTNSFNLQNTPNPFKPSTNITFNVPARSSIIIAIYDITGKKVAILANNEFNPGSYATLFDATKLASGLYVCRLDVRQLGTKETSRSCITKNLIVQK